ncbi:S-methyl-5'-thioadenosine phosphorylase [Candidatus Woesearchaeota archaeon]|nr:S-methyl-5'-thioadenosine phosphorylase [Candidatus Woesearchaeota archaeon]
MAIGIIGGSGVYEPKLLSDIEQIKIKTPYGMTSDVITKGSFKGKDIYILPRHGLNHQYNPTNVPYRANIWALKDLGVTKLLTVSAVGSLKEEYRPGDFVFTDQFIDRTTKREQSFYNTVHLSVAEPFCNGLREKLAKRAEELKLRYHKKGTCVVIEGPRFSTKAESKLYRSWDADIINMTLVPEAVLAREAEICYANIATVTDYDVWKDHVVSYDQVIKVMNENIEKVKKLLMAVLEDIDDKKVCSCNEALKDAGM